MRMRTAALATMAAATLGTVLVAAPAQAVTQNDITINISDGLCLDIPQSNPYNGQVVQQWWCNGTNAQKWNRVDAGAHYFKIQSAAWPQFCLNNWTSGGAVGAEIKLYKCDSNDSAFNIVGVDFGNYYQFQPRAASKNCSTMTGQNAGDPMRLAPCSDNGSNSRFRLFPAR
ncbi:RICIN domain-containing protein [Streptomyces sp. NBC_00273]|uniref:RICIN domain-containing protein n=1 Tax=Streptomyces sp. NBC_00273 TaxID=2903644 RepID=UPI002E2AC30F|nr:RICIN domain-containing protein [Streptomyces sp. NBC_00273]